MEPRLASDSAWFLLCTKRPVKPLIYQQRKKAKFVSKTNETDDNVFMSKKFIYGADSRGNAAGDRIKFEPITAAEFAALAAKEGTA